MDAKDIIRTGLENVDRTLERTLSGLTAEEIAWHPVPDANSIGLILLHMAHSEDSYIQRIIQGKPTLWETEKWYAKLGKDATDTGSHYMAEQVAAFQPPDIKDLRAYMQAVRKQTLSYLDSLTPGQLDARFEPPQFPSPPGAPPRRFPFESIVGVMLTVNVTHLAQHAGEISYIRGLKRGMDK